MNFLAKHAKPFFVLLFVTALALYGCSAKETITEQSFVGKWKSSKMLTPVYLYANGEWEIKTEDGGILQFGTWQYKDKKVIWSFKQSDASILRDVNPVLSVTPKEFQLKENDRTTTIFTRFD